MSKRNPNGQISIFLKRKDNLSSTPLPVSPVVFILDEHHNKGGELVHRKKRSPRENSCGIVTLRVNVNELPKGRRFHYWYPTAVTIKDCQGSCVCGYKCEGKDFRTVSFYGMKNKFTRTWERIDYPYPNKCGCQSTCT